MELNQVDVHFLIVAILCDNFGIGFLYYRRLGRTTSKEVKVLASGVFLAWPTLRYGGYSPDGAYRSDNSFAR